VKDYYRVSHTAVICCESIKGLWDLTLAVLAYDPCLVAWQQWDPVLVLAYHGMSTYVYLVALVLVECDWLTIHKPESQVDQVV